MAYPSIDQYGAIRPEPKKQNSHSLRPIMIAASLFAIAAVVSLLAPRSGTEKVEMEILPTSPEKKLDRLAQEFVAQGATMSVKEMEAKLDQWRNDPDTLLDLPQNARSQVYQMQGAQTRVRLTVFLIPDACWHVSECTTDSSSSKDFFGKQHDCVLERSSHLRQVR